MKPYFAVIFTSQLSNETEGYAQMASHMEQLASKQPGYLGFESAREELGISISYWESLEAIKQWKENLEHQRAQALGRKRWYSQYTIRICRIEREYSFDKPSNK